MHAIQSTRHLSAEYVFPGPSGGPMVYNTELKRLHTLCDRVGVPRYSLHQIRHLVGTRASQAGLSKKAIANVLGQADTGATERYMHAAQPEQWAVVKNLEAEFSELLDDTQQRGDERG